MSRVLGLASWSLEGQAFCDGSRWEIGYEADEFSVIIEFPSRSSWANQQGGLTAILLVAKPMGKRRQSGGRVGWR